MRTLLASVAVLAVPLALLATPRQANAPQTAVDAPSAAAPARPATSSRAAGPSDSLRVTTLVRGLSHPWDVAPLPSGDLLVTQRDPAALTLVRRTGRAGLHATTRDVAFPSSRVWQSGETGLMGLVVDPAFTRNQRFYTCSGWNTGGEGHDVRVNAWRLVDHATRARLLGPLVTGFPTTSGRHGGCRLLIARDGSLYVGTGDAATGTNPENLNSLGGKTLRLNRMTGRPWPTNPFVHSRHPSRRYVQTYGHRNVQGLAQRADGSVWSIEQGTYRDDEVNRLRTGADYGYNPVPGYNESVPMTDQRLPGRQTPARWRSGPQTLAASGGTWVPRHRWGRLGGTLAVAMLKAERALFLRFDSHGRLRHTSIPAALTTEGRLRTVVALPDGSLVVPTDDDAPGGRLLLVRPPA